MPRKRRSKAPVGLSKKSKQTIGAIAQNTEEETFEALIHDFDVQGSTVAGYMANVLLTLICWPFY